MFSKPLLFHGFSGISCVDISWVSQLEKNLGLLDSNIISTLIVIVAVVVTDIVIELLFLKKVSNRRRKKRLKVITRNILIGFLMLCLIKIWVEGFIHILALVGFVSAALTITQKENILNLTGGLIIMWRNAFSEGDYISILGNSGIINNIGIFYFTIDEVIPYTLNEQTGKQIKIPNSLISLHPFKIHQFDHFLVIDKSYYYSFKSEVTKLNNFCVDLEALLNQKIKQLSESLTTEEKKEYIKLNNKKTLIQITVHLSLVQNDHNGYKMRVWGHCPASQVLTFYHFIEEQIMLQTKDKKINLLE